MSGRDAAREGERPLLAQRHLPAWAQLLRLVPDIAHLLVALARDPRVPLRAKIVAGAAAFYLVNPIDLIPDFVPVIGQVDDITAVVWALRSLLRSAGYDVVRDLWRGTEDGFALLLIVTGMER